MPLLVRESISEYGVKNAHDKLFKSLLDDKEELKTFIEKFIGINIQNEEIEEDTENMIKKFKIEEEINMKTAQDYIREEIKEIKRKSKEEGRIEGRELGRTEGKRLGRTEGMALGRAEEQKHIIINMIKNKLKIQEIKKYTGVDEEEIEEIATSVNV